MAYAITNNFCKDLSPDFKVIGLTTSRCSDCQPKQFLAHQNVSMMVHAVIGGSTFLDMNETRRSCFNWNHAKSTQGDILVLSFMRCSDNNIVHRRQLSHLDESENHTRTSLFEAIQCDKDIWDLWPNDGCSSTPRYCNKKEDLVQNY